MRLIDADALDMYECLRSYYGDAWRDAQKAIDDAPTIDPVKHGHWIMTNKEKTDRPLPECSRCGWYVTKGGVLDFTYCPNCGAKMDEMKVNNSKGIDLWMTKEDFNSLYEDDVEDGV